MSENRKPTPEQIAALQRFAAAHGRKWKEVLSMTYWYNARIWRDGQPDDGMYLHQVRNHLGPTWLDKFKLPKDGLGPWSDTAHVKRAGDPGPALLKDLMSFKRR